MNMHPKPQLRYNKAVEPFTVSVQYAEHLEHAVRGPEPFTMKFIRVSDGAGQLLTMTAEEALGLYEQLATMLRYRDAKAADIDADEWREFHFKLAQVIE